ncbi:MAG: hypothetical protein ACKVS7_10075 [Gemmatimonadaceae bacterium]
MRRVSLLVVLALVLSAASCRVSLGGGSRAPFPTGSFVDDYGSRHEISAVEWRQDAYTRTRIVRSHPTARYILGRSIPRDSTALGGWVRIDWIPLDSPPYTWAYCIIAYDKPDAASAEAVATAKPETPRTGCNGFPFTRLQPAPQSAPAAPSRTPSDPAR